MYIHAVQADAVRSPPFPLYIANDISIGCFKRRMNSSQKNPSGINPPLSIFRAYTCTYIKTVIENFQNNEIIVIF